MDQSTSEEITLAVKELVDQIAPDVRFVSKYGGEVFALDPDDDKQFFGGIFTYKDHVSVEFSNGASFDDSDDHLEGSGKMRRHLKLRTPGDIKEKEQAAYVRQAVAD
ncbi:DUF1801 domain-containing protein [Roseobacter sp. CCS2]|uniref:DUF1801 domain-containing protein n=1 Tax=Roseobacter sp. CCS2 TaxID=391593 RepID=UPI0000F400B1|nr:DUF1801 domain-containing protein [Roseobacter sp. CCS2]EBA13224.1 hypothetical protein RCCS2_05044 [Roseobacter sp. CCS2]